LTTNELVLTFGGLHLCVQFGENRQRNATVRVMTHGQTDTHTDRQTQTDFIICPMLYTMAMGQITMQRYTTQHGSKCTRKLLDFARTFASTRLSRQMHISSEKRHIFRCVLTDNEHPLSAFHSTEPVLSVFCKRPFTQLTDVTDHLL